MQGAASQVCPCHSTRMHAAKIGHQNRPPKRAAKTGRQDRPSKQAVKTGRQNRPPKQATNTGRQNRPPKKAARTGHHVTIGDEIRLGQFLHRISAPAGDAFDTSIEPPKQATKIGRQNGPPKQAAKTGRQNRPPGVRERAALPFQLYHSLSSQVFFLTGEPLKCRPRPTKVPIGMALEGLGTMETYDTVAH